MSDSMSTCIADVLGDARSPSLSRGVQVVGPIDHGFIQVDLLRWPRGLEHWRSAAGTNINGEAWIDPEVVGLCGITEAELEALKEPAGFDCPAHPVPQPSTPHASSVQDDEQPAWYSRVIALTDDEVWERMKLANASGPDGGLMVQFGIFDHIEGMPGTAMGQLLRDRLELIKVVDQAGFYAYHLAEHHGTDLCMAPNQEIFLAAAAQVTDPSGWARSSRSCRSITRYG